jgi:glucose/arabinose dehydrogenase
MARCPLTIPFVGRAGAKPEIYTYGHRNGYGLAVNPETGGLWHQPWARPGMDNPRIHWVPSISPSSIIFYTGDKFPK